jgi:hypothetical protein
MSWRLEWKALSSRVQALVETGRFMLTSLAAQNTDQFGVTRHYVLPEAREIVAGLDAFRRRHEAVLPPLAAAAIKDLLAKITIGDGSGNHPILDLQVIAPLGVLVARVEYLLRESEAPLKALTERAFEHLQRMIVSDSLTRDRWRAAFASGETSCEALGGAHLLSHGIWGFKAKGTGDAPGAAEATDLVYQEPIPLETAERVAEGLVLTEWKLVRSVEEAEPQAEVAIRQAELYRAGVLGGLELTRTRYVVLVSEDIRASTSERRVSEVAYRTVMIRVNPSPPSKAARRP